MLKYLFAFIVLIHGLIHFMGFAKAFNYGNITQLTKDISKPAGILWMATAFLFIAVVILFLFKKEGWAIIAIITVFFSQILIILSWKDAKFGTAANIIVLLAALPSFAIFNFNKMVKQEAGILMSQHVTDKSVITKEAIVNLPPVIQKWLLTSGIAGKEKIEFIRLQQKGEIRTKPGGKWMPFTATQYFTVNTPAFNWQTTVEMMPLITLNGRDKFENGKGEMLIKLLSLIKVADARNDTHVDASAMLRYLGETCWFPSAALENYMQWQTIDSLSAKATMHYNSTAASGIFQFNANGDLISFSGDRWYGSGKDATLEKWLIEIKEYKTFQGIRVPNKCEVTWKLKAGDFTWLKLEITNVEYNKSELY